MRIISGKFGGRRITFPAHFPVRPTTDFAKSALFNILTNRYDLSTCVVLDLFCGAGGISFELVSRGCPEVVSVDKNKDCINFISRTSKELGVSEIQPVKSDAITYLESCSRQFDLVFADPPYDYNRIKLIPELVFSGSLVNPGGCFILEHLSSDSYSSLPYFKEFRKYGNVGFTIFEKS